MFQNIYKNKKVLVTGHTGFKGSWLCLWLTKLGAKVYGISDGMVTKPCHFELLELENNITHYIADIRDLHTLKGIVDKIQPEIVFHLAARAIVRNCYDNPVDAFETNIMGSINVLESLRSITSVKAAVMITSDKCYENVEWEYGYREDDRLGGKDPYSASKACAEIAFSAYFRSFLSNKNLNIGIARAGNVIGGGDWAESRIVPDCIKAWNNNQEVEIRSPGATRPWQHVLEPLSGYLWFAALLFQSDELNGESFNLGPSSDVTQPVSVLIDEMQKVWKNHSWRTDAEGEGHRKEAGLLKLCCDKALFHLEWLPTLKFTETTEMTARWYFEYYKNNRSVEELTLSQIEQYEKFACERNIVWAK